MQLIVEDTSNCFWRVGPAPGGITHAWLGIEVKRARGGWVPKARARKWQLVRKAGCRIIATLDDGQAPTPAVAA